MAILSQAVVTPSGTAASYVSASPGGDKVRPSARTFIHVKNAGGGSVTVTVDDTLTKAPAGAAEFNPDLEVVIAPGTEKFIGPFPPARFRGADGHADISYSGTTSVTVAALKI